MSSYQKSILREVVLAWAAVILISRLAIHFSFISFIGANVALVTAVLLLYVPIGIHLAKKEKAIYFEASFKDLLNSLRSFVIASVIVFPIFLLAAHFYQSLFGYSYNAASLEGFGEIIFVELLMVALPEEFFFRGYLQGRLNQVWQRRWCLWGIKFGPALLVVSFIFALSHSLITVQWWHLFIFFPSLIFGLLYEKHHTITAAVLFHTLSNLAMRWIAIHYF